MKKIVFALIVILGLGLCCQANASAGPSAACAAPSAKAPKAKTAVVTFKTSMRCHNCVKKITENISFGPFVSCGWALGSKMRDAWKEPRHQSAFNATYGVALTVEF